MFNLLFSVGVKFFTDTGERFNRIYTGNKIGRASISLEEGRPVTMNVDFMGTGMRHDLGGGVIDRPEFTTMVNGAVLAGVNTIEVDSVGTVNTDIRVGDIIDINGDIFSVSSVSATTLTVNPNVPNDIVDGEDVTRAVTEISSIPRFRGDGVGPDTTTTTPTTRDFDFARISSQPYFFSTAEVKFLGTTFARFRNLNIEINNQIEPLFYVHGDDGASITDARQSPIEILEGRRAITLRGSLDADGTDIGGSTSNATFFEQLLTARKK